MVGMPATLVDHRCAQLFRQLLDTGHQALHWPLGKLGALHCGIEVVDVSLVVLGVVDLHGLRIDMRFQGIVGVRQGRQGKSHFNELHKKRAQH
ncbi:hypothetical protein D3C81_1695990 [compost metagenome]